MLEQDSNKKDIQSERLIGWWLLIIVICFLALLGLCYAIGWALAFFGLQSYTPVTISFLSLPMAWIAVDKM